MGRFRQVHNPEAYKGTGLTNEDLHDILIRAVDQRVLANARIPAVLGEWRQPKHSEFEPRTAWSAFNAFTEVLKAVPELELPRRTVTLHGLFDGVAGLLTSGAVVVGDAQDADVRVNLN